MSDPMLEAVALVARRPRLAPSYMALRLKQDPRELQVRLDVATRLGWLCEERACCGRESRYVVTEKGSAILEAGIAGEVDGAVGPLRA